MIAPKEFLKVARRVSLALGTLLCGALLFAIYLDHTMANPPEAVRDLRAAGILAYLLLILGFEPRPARVQSDPSPAFSGPAALLVTSLFAAGMMVSSTPDMIPVAILTGLIGTFSAFLLWRFARNYSGEIGEARFGPDGKPLGPWQPPKG